MKGKIEFYRTVGTYGCFSNFSRHPVTFATKVYPTSEHAFQAQKYVDTAPEHAEAIRLSSTPTKAKALGWSRKYKVRADWDTARLMVMREILRAKFTQHPLCRAVLLSTGDQELVEHTKNDAFWGDGGGGKGKGENQLGKALMDIRRELRL